MTNKLPSDEFMKALLCHTFGVTPVSTNIISNGSKWAGEEPDTLDELCEVLKTEPLNRIFREERAKVAAEQCRCEKCWNCDGRGYTRGGWDGFQTEPCEECDNGITDTCDRCQLLADMDHEDEVRS